MYDLNNEYTNYIRWRNVINDGMCSPWEVWLDLGTYPLQSTFTEAIRHCGFMESQLCVRAYASEYDNSQLIDYGLRKQFYIPDITDWDLSIYKNQED